MRARLILIMLVSLLFWAPRPAAAVSCDSHDARFICGLESAEDLVRLGRTPWVIASHHVLPFGPLSAIHVRTRAVRTLYPAADAGARHDPLYPDCENPPSVISSHGVNALPLGGGRYRLLMANHGERESVEIFDVMVGAKGPRATWRGCILAPDGIAPNGVAALDHDGVALSGGKAAVWRPGRGWRYVEGVVHGNGIEVTRDGRSLLIAVSVDGTVVRAPVDGGPITATASTGFRPDNLRYGDDGMLYVAGQDPHAPSELPHCLEPQTIVCDMPFAFARIDPDTLRTSGLRRFDGFAGAFGGGTTALKIGEDFWFGTFRGDRVAVVKAD